MNEALLVIDVQNDYFTGSMQVTHPRGTLLRYSQGYGPGTCQMSSGLGNPAY